MHLPLVRQQLVQFIPVAKHQSSTVLVIELQYLSLALRGTVVHLDHLPLDELVSVADIDNDLLPPAELQKQSTLRYNPRTCKLYNDSIFYLFNYGTRDSNSYSRSRNFRRH
jgi:hypothetical protein